MSFPHLEFLTERTHSHWNRVYTWCFSHRLKMPDIKIRQKDQSCRWQKRVNIAWYCLISTGFSVNVSLSRCRSGDEPETPRLCFSGNLRTSVTRWSDSTVAASTGSATGRTSLTRMRYQARASYKGWKRWVHRVADPRGEYPQRPPPLALGPNYLKSKAFLKISG